jgi:NADPH:quinone reductase-like Zn-dependent oxidoreductase
MKAIRIDKHGPPKVLQFTEVPDPEVQGGQVLIRVRAAGVNFADILARLGLYRDAPKPPFIPGLEVSGEIERVGGEAKGLYEGQRVMALTRWGGYAEKVCASSPGVMPLPPSMTFEQAAALPVNYLTAYHMLFYMGNLRPKERVLIHAVAGGVGLAAVELSKIAGAEIFGTASSSKFKFLRERGIHHLIDYCTQDFEKEVRRLTGGEGVDMVLDAVGGESFAKSYRLLRPAGRLMVFGFSTSVSGPKRSYLKAALGFMKTPRFHPLRMMGGNRAVIGVHLGRLRPEIIGQEYEALFKHYAEGHISPYVGKTFPLSQAATAHQYIHERKNIGKVLLIP